MLSIGEFSKICKVSTKTLRYYAEIGLILPSEINPETGYRYYAIEQLETMLLIIRLKSYNFSLEEIKQIIESGELYEEKLYVALANKREEIKRLLHEQEKRLHQLECDLSNLKNGKPIMSYLDDIDVEFVEVPGIDGETGFVTEVLTEDQFEQRAAKLEVIQRIRVV